MLSVKIITPSGLYKECDAQMVNARSVEGAFGVLPKHMPVVAMLDISELQLIFANGERKDYAVAGGLFPRNRSCASRCFGLAMDTQRPGLVEVGELPRLPRNPQGTAGCRVELADGKTAARRHPMAGRRYCAAC